MKINYFSSDHILDIPIRNSVGESSFWNNRDRTWNWIDQTGSIYKYSQDNNQLYEYKVNQRLGCITPTDDNNLLVAGEHQIFLIRGGKEHLLFDFKHEYEGMKFGDGHCDRQGRFILSNMYQDISKRNKYGNWYSFYKRRENYSISYLNTPHLIIPNGSAFNAKGDIFYFCETDTKYRRIFKCKYDIDEGVIYHIDLYIDLSDLNVGRPDGASIDVDGCYWISCLDEGMILRITPNGNIDQIFRTPMKKPTMCSFGGKDYRTLFITSLCRGELDLQEDPYGGRCLIIETNYQGLPTPSFNIQGI
ncbi:SMP-30/gluconolactonase/LRE family protein [Gallibacterium sp. AGMB14963]|uniref:SMP-30/gluconolactonase/LRE family protein n=1 Tax=Gallibacterium faecale TaxID=3019086 RepID=UPI0022F1D2A7|nr:SMP-30/gluconolactonase/LRE family protein [Gallibacterium sp. AGMB14963]MDA3979396.1 SMP-30/gluconolactonase/LRE family protein [Gallibacterium sp. AGMB14963]